MITVLVLEFLSHRDRNLNFSVHFYFFYAMNQCLASHVVMILLFDHLEKKFNFN